MRLLHGVTRLVLPHRRTKMQETNITKEDLQVALKEASEKASDTITKGLKVLEDGKAGTAELKAVADELKEMKDLHETFTDKAQAQIDEMEKRLAAKTVSLNDKEINLKSFRNTIKCLKKHGNDVKDDVVMETLEKDYGISRTQVSGYDKKDADLSTLGALISTANGGGFEANPENISPLKSYMGTVTRAGTRDVARDIINVDGAYMTSDTGGGTNSLIDNESFRIRLDVLKARAVIAVDEDIDEDIDYNIQSTVITPAMDNIEALVAKQLINGDGSRTSNTKAAQLTGLVNVARTPSATWAFTADHAKFIEVASATSGKVNHTDLAGMREHLNYNFRQGQVWVMNSKTFFALSVEKGTDGHFVFPQNIWQADALSLYGIPVVIDENMPNVAANSISVFLVNLRVATTYYERQGMRMRLVPTNDGQNVIITKRLAAGSHFGRACVALKTKA